MDLLDFASWPPDLINCLQGHKHRLLTKERRDQKHAREKQLLYRKPLADQLAWMGNQNADGFDYPAYENALTEIVSVVRRHTLLGYHNTRLTTLEVRRVLSGGMQVCGPELIESRIRAIQQTGEIGARLARKFLQNNDAEESCRRGMIWFCFYPPYLAGEHGIESLLRYWGGEALYRSWRDDPAVSPKLQSIGAPCVVEAEVPAVNLSPHSYLGAHVSRQFLIHEGHKITEPALHEDWSSLPVAPSSVRRVIQYPEPEFIRLTRCDEWMTALG